MKVAIGSKNRVKIACVEEAFKKVWPEEDFTFEGVDVPSGVPDQPMSDEESITGATNRANRAMGALDADFGVGLEGGLQQTAGSWYDCGWIVVIDKNGMKGIGSTVKMVTPPKMMELIMQGTELGLVNDSILNKKNTKQGGGHFGHMTNNIITRQSGYRDGVVSALAAFLHPDLF
jgi:inosine/xanthosine triphosphatase